MLAEVRISLFASDLSAADITHGVPAIANELVAAGRFDEREVALGTGAFDRCRGRRLDCSAQRCLFRFEARVRVAPGCQAPGARGSAALRIEAAEFEAATPFVDASPGLSQGVGSWWVDSAEEINEASEEEKRDSKEEGQKKACKKNTLHSRR